MAHFSSTACTRCREQKLKCSREHPICLRCKRLQAHCSYPLPPNRQRQRAQRSIHPKSSRTCHPENASQYFADTNEQMTLSNESATVSKLRNENQVRQSDIWRDHTPYPDYRRRYPSGGQQQRFSPLGNISSDSYPNQLRTEDRDSNAEILGAKRTPETSALPPVAAGLALLEIYFSRVYNATLLFSKPFFFQQYLEGKVPGYLLRAIFATASLFLATDGDKETGEFSELKALHAFHGRSLSWAQTAASEAASIAILNPSLQVVQTLECLTLYWFGSGYSKSGDISLALAYRCCCILGYGGNPSDLIEDAEVSLDAELKRRCMWACWASMCIIAAPEPYLRRSWSEMAQVPLPSNISHTPSGIKIDLGEYMDSNWSSQSINRHPVDEMAAPVSAALMKMVGVWAKVQLFVQDCSKHATSRKLEELTSISKWATFIHSTVSESQRNKVNQQNASDQAHQLFLHDSLHHLSQMTLYSTLVPLLCGSPVSINFDHTLMESSAKKVVQHAWLFAGELKEYCGTERDATYMCPLIGHCSFTSAAVLLAFEISSEGRGFKDLIQEFEEIDNIIPMVKFIVGILYELSRYWKILGRPCEKLSIALTALSVPGDYQSTHISGVEPPDGQSLTLTEQNLVPEERSEGLCAADEYGSWGKSSHTLLQQHTQVQTNVPPEEEQLRQNLYSRTSVDDTGFSTSSAAFPAETEGPATQSGVWADNWLNTSFAAAGYDELAVLEPVMLFRETWEGCQ